MNISSGMMFWFFSALLLSLFLSASAQSCEAYTFSNQITYRACDHLHALNSYLHWNYDEESCTLEIAYRHAGIDPSRWIAWAVNPSVTGMLGSQALVAYQNSKGILHAYTSPVTSYATQLHEGPLSFQVPKISAEYANNEMIIYATIMLPKNTTTVNHVWQEGPVNEDGPGMHSLSGENVKSMGTVDLLLGKVVATKGGGSSSLLFKKVHGGLNMVSWGILMPMGAMTARYMKVFKSADPAWFYAHIICQSLAYTLGIVGAGTGLYLGSKSPGIQYDAHRSIGIVLLVLGFLQVLALKLRPNKDHKYRSYWNMYHHGVGYIVIILSIVNIFFGFSILHVGQTWKLPYSVILIVLGSISAIMEAFTWIVIRSSSAAEKCSGERDGL